MKKGQRSGGPARRTVLRGAAAAVGLGAAGFPTIWAQNIRNVTLRQFGLGVSNMSPIAERCRQDTGINLVMTALDSDAVTRRAMSEPQAFDIADIEYFTCEKAFPAGNLQPMDVRRIRNFERIVPIFTTGKLRPDSMIAQGTTPHSVAFVTSADSLSFAKEPTRWATMVPTVYNADTLGVRPDLAGRSLASWKDFLDPAFKGRTALIDIPSIGMIDAAMICEAAGIIRYRDKGNMTRAEIDRTVAFLIELKRAGHFHGFWKLFEQSIEMMASGKVVVQSMWGAAVTAVRSRGIACLYPPLAEGYRAWAGGLSLARHLKGLELDAAYEYVNWYLSGWVGAWHNRQGYYPAVLETARPFMSEDEWGYWIEGQPARGDIVNPFGQVMERAGARRDGGSFQQRMGSIACWNTVMDEDAYMLEKWAQFQAA